MNKEQAQRQAWLDWAQTGEFNASQFDGDAKKAYSEAAETIQRQWDTQEQ
jgi:hypothetical protein